MAGVRQDGERVVVAPGNPAGALRMVIATLVAGLPGDEAQWPKEWVPFAAGWAQMLAHYLGLRLPTDFFPTDESGDRSRKEENSAAHP
jgi:hypothetical protein